MKRIEKWSVYQTVTADVATVTVRACARIRANASLSLGRQAAEPDVLRTLRAQKDRKNLTNSIDMHIVRQEAYR